MVVTLGGNILVNNCNYNWCKRRTVSLASGASQSGFGRTGTVDWQTGSIKTGDFTAANGEGFFVDTNQGAITATLPSGSSRINCFNTRL